MISKSNAESRACTHLIERVLKGTVSHPTLRNIGHDRISAAHHVDISFSAEDGTFVHA